MIGGRSLRPSSNYLKRIRDLRLLNRISIDDSRLHEVDALNDDDEYEELLDICTELVA